MKTTPVDTLLWLYHSGHEVFVWSAYLTLLDLAEDPSTPAGVLARLATERLQRALLKKS